MSSFVFTSAFNVRKCTTMFSPEDVYATLGNLITVNNKYKINVPKHVNYAEYLTKANLEIDELCHKAYRLMVETGEKLEYEFPYVLQDKDGLDPVEEAMIEAMTSTEYYENAYANLF